MRLQVRSLRESRGDVAEAGPSIAVQMIGLNGVPTAGDEFAVCESEQEVCAAHALPALLQPASLFTRSKRQSTTVALASLPALQARKQAEAIE
jgi:hypothetical protein